MHRHIRNELIFEIFIGFYLIAVVTFCWHRPVWTTLLLCGALGMQLWFWGEKADAAAMASAALLGTPSEIICVKYGVWTYYAPGLLFGIPVWIPLVWASLFCLFRRISMTTHEIIEIIWPGSRELARKIFFVVLGGLIAAYYVIVVLSIRPTIAMVYSIFMLLAVIFWHGERDILIFVIGAVLGTLGEYICMKLGFWRYHFPFFRSIGLPISLPLAWGLSAVIVGRVAGNWEVRDSSASHVQVEAS